MSKTLLYAVLFALVTTFISVSCESNNKLTENENNLHKGFFKKLLESKEHEIISKHIELKPNNKYLKLRHESQKKNNRFRFNKDDGSVKKLRRVTRQTHYYDPNHSSIYPNLPNYQYQQQPINQYGQLQPSFPNTGSQPAYNPATGQYNPPFNGNPQLNVYNTPNPNYPAAYNPSQQPPYTYPTAPLQPHYNQTYPYNNPSSGNYNSQYNYTNSPYHPGQVPPYNTPPYNYQNSHNPLYNQTPTNYYQPGTGTYFPQPNAQYPNYGNNSPSSYNQYRVKISK